MTVHMAADVPSYQSAATTHTLPESTDLTSAFTLKGVRQVKGGITVIDDIELAIPHGAIIALVGPSGAGKSTSTTSTASATLVALVAGGSLLGVVDDQHLERSLAALQLQTQRL